MYKSFSSICGLGILFLLVSCGDDNKSVNSESQNSSSASEFSKEADSNAKNAENKKVSDKDGTVLGEGKNIEKISTVGEVEKGAVSQSDDKASLRKKSSVKYDGTLPESEEDLIELINAPIEDVSENGDVVPENENMIDQSEEVDFVAEQTDGEVIPVYEMDGRNEGEMLASEGSAGFDSPTGSGGMPSFEVAVESDSPIISEEMSSEDQTNFNVPIESEGTIPPENAPNFEVSGNYGQMTPSENFSGFDQSMTFEPSSEEVNGSAEE